MELDALKKDLQLRLGTIALLAKGDGVITSDALASAGKKAPAVVGRQKCDCAKSGAVNGACKCAETTKDISLSVDILKARQDKQLVTGIVLVPETVDGQGDIYSAEVIEEAAHAFLANYNSKTTLGFQHKEFKANRFALVESWIAPMDLVIGTQAIKAGSWIITVKVLLSADWKLIKDGKIKGFSIGGKAKVKRLQATESPKGGQQL